MLTVANYNEKQNKSMRFEPENTEESMVIPGQETKLSDLVKKLSNGQQLPIGIEHYWHEDGQEELSELEVNDFDLSDITRIETEIEVNRQRFELLKARKKVLDDEAEAIKKAEDDRTKGLEKPNLDSVEQKL